MNFQNTDVFKGKSITVDAEALTLVVQAALENISLENTPTAALANLGVALQTLVPGSSKLPGTVVMPKIGKNNLRAGNTAYPNAVVICTSPFIVASEDGLHCWENQKSEHFNVVGKHPAVKTVELQRTHLGRLKGKNK